MTLESFTLAGSNPSVSLKASSTKNRRPADHHPIPLALVPDLRGGGSRTSRLAFPSSPSTPTTAKAIRIEALEAAGIPYETDDGVADFHSLRAYFVSALVRSGASIKETQTLARHAKPETTLKHYAKVSARPACRRGGAPAPRKGSNPPEAVAATGTEGTYQEPLAPFLPHAGDAFRDGYWRNVDA